MQRFGFQKFMALAGICAALSLGGAAQADNLSVGAITDYETAGIGIVVQYDGPARWTSGDFEIGFGGAVRLDADGDAWIGAGFVATVPLSDAFFAELSFMPGYYAPGDTVLGGNLHFRSLAGLGVNVGDTGALILSIDHLSNGNLHQVNPGSEAIALRYRMSF